MSEISTFGKIGLALLIIAAVLGSTYCVLVVTSTFSRDYVEEQTTMLDRTETELKDIVGVYLPTLAVNQAISSSRFKSVTNILCTYEEYGYVNGVYSKEKTVLCEDVDWYEFLKEFSSNTVCVTKIEEGASSLHLYIKIGG